MAGFKPGVGQLAPDSRQLFQPRAKQVDALAAGHFAVELVTFGDLPDGDQSVRRHFPCRHPRHHRIAPVLLDIGEIAVVGILQRQVRRLQQVLVPAGGQHRGHQRFADIAAVPLAVAANQLLEGMDMVNPHQVVDLLARPREMFADVFFHFDALLRQLILHHLFHQRAAAAAAGSRSGAAFYRRHIPRPIVHRLADIAFADVMAGADRRAVRQRRDAERLRRGSLQRGQDQTLRTRRQRHAVQHHLQQRGIVAGIPHQHAAKQGFAVLTDDDFFVNLLRTVGPLIALTARRAPLRIAKRGHVDPQQLQFGAHVGAAKAGVLSCEGGCGDPRHLIARRHQAVNFIIPQGAFAYRQHVRVRGAALAVDVNSPAFAHLQRAAAGQRVLRADPRREDHHVGPQRAAVGKVQPQAVGLAHDGGGRFAGMHPHAEGDDLLPEHRRPAVIQLDGHQVRGKLHHLRLQPQLFQGVGRLQPEQPAADNHPALRRGGMGGDTVEIVKSAVDKAPREIVTGDWRNKGIRAGRQHQFIPVDFMPLGVPYQPCFAVDGRHRLAEAEFNTVFNKEIPGRQRQRLGAASGKILGEMYPVVGGVTLFAKHHDSILLMQIAAHALFEKMVADHAMSHQH